MSWDGRVVAHCTAVPMGVGADDSLLSMFVGEYERVAMARQRMHALDAALSARVEQASPPPLAVDDYVWVRWDARGDGWCRRALARIGAWHPDGGVTLVWAPDSRSISRIAYDAIPEMVHAGATSGVPAELCGAALVGRRIGVFWPAEDTVFPGVVTAFNAPSSEHTVTYDDGEVLRETLCWPSGAPGFVLL